ncbi:hypothetical protein [Deinococcus radiophilus]|uniref:Uncharacterized protein n=1 Tax=Deinococcus radiophilus TaxID=32062 RepID=A0A431VRX0_9DEIO|nr:hypothetical protein [Deinococcus radiophilus]RTR25891.1 hypothetical protein EJ104_09280 [Deinococcus radiophilus]UFA49681.1 hypothetical protein LMT64_07195 [Deinococcus radiophilus]
MDRFIDALVGEIAEMAVIDYLHRNGKYAVSAVDKRAPNPDPGHDIHVRNLNNEIVRCSVKSSISALKSSPEDILSTFSPAFNQEEPREFNIQVYFYYTLFSAPRYVVPSLSKGLITGWFSREALQGALYVPYPNAIQRRRAEVKLKDIQPMSELLEQLT